MVGGGGENYGAWSDEPYGWFVEKAGYGKIINIDVDEASDWYPTYFESLGANITSYNLQIATVAEANSFTVYQELLSADGISSKGVINGIISQLGKTPMSNLLYNPFM